MRPEIIVITIGNELLDGRVVNTNLAWIGKRLKDLGYDSKKCYVIGDDLEEISRTVKAALRENPVFIITSGGLGPTWDDMTLQGVARALGRTTGPNELALKWVGQAVSGKMTTERLKMAILPEGAQPLRNRKGVAPGVLLKEKNSLLISLPGVPEEMISIFEHEVLLRIRKRLGRRESARADLYVQGMPEASVAPLIQNVRAIIKGVYIKTHVLFSETRKAPLRIHLSLTGRDARWKVQREKSLMKSLVKESGGTISKMRSIRGH
jgi:nicotinamide-nucleotide amidase